MVATWDGHELFTHPGGAPAECGALLTLTAHAKADFLVSMGATSAQVFAGKSDIAVRLPAVASPDSLVDEAVPVAQEALDMFAASGGPTAVLDLSPESELAWWKDGQQARARLMVHYGLGVTTRANITVIDSAGQEVVQPPLPPVAHHESYRYFRLSQATDDLFDAFRNAYLALESVLADVTPKTGGSERSWLLLALANAEGPGNLATVLSCAHADFPARFYKDIYQPVRCRLFHAKALGLDPASPSDREKVLKAYRSVVACYLALAKKRYGLRGQGGGGLASAGFLALSPLFDAWTVKAGSELGEGEFSLAELPRVTVPSEPDRIKAKGVATSPFDPALTHVSFIAAFDKGNLAFSHSMDGQLNTGGLSQFEVVLDFWNRYNSGYRTSFRA
jgi:hypothetical protein